MASEVVSISDDIVVRCKACCYELDLNKDESRGLYHIYMNLLVLHYI